MRLHQLTATAFGPFASDVEVDLDALSASGLFLLCGPTGAGKTSVLDAVCFALYGDVPGDRGSARRLRSDLAADGVAPRVVLELTVGGRRFRFTRSPQWTRPKRRGSGTTNQQASVLVEERRDHGWESLTTRLDEAGQLVTELLGMNLPQFCQVALLPQGRFQDFLRARSEERHTLLQQLFGTRRFADIERWVRERARALHREADDRQRAVTGVLSRVQEAGGTELPEDLDLDDSASAGALLDWAGELVASAGMLAEASATRLGEHARAERVAAAALDAGGRTADLQQRHLDATLTLQELQSDAEAHAERSHRLWSARRAAPAAPLHALAVDARRRREAATALAERSRALAAPLVDADQPTAEDLATAAVATRARLTRLEDLAPREAELTALERGCTRHERRIGVLTDEATTLQERTRELPGRIRQLRTELDASVAAAHALAGLRAESADLRQHLDAHTALAATARDLAEARRRAAHAALVCHDLKESWLALREARLDGMAAEIAAGLAVGSSCPVCGSHEHPHKAVRGTDAPDADAERAARRMLDDAEVARVAVDGRVHDLETACARLAEQAGDLPPGELLTALEAVTSALATTEQSAARTPALRADLACTEAEEAAARERCRAVEVELAALRSTLAADRSVALQTRTALEHALHGTGCAAVGALIGRLSRHLSHLERATTAADSLATATQAALDAEAALTAWVDDHGFGSVSEALDCVVPPEEVDRLQEEVRAHDDRLAAVRAVLEDPVVSEAARTPTPDVDALRSVHEQASSHLTAARTQAQVHEARARRLSELAAQLSAAVSAWVPVRAEHRVAADLAGLLEGTSADNELRMRLSAYVLAWRLGQVVDAANDRLLRMSDRRYSLEHTGRRGAGERRGGLSLQVRDEWSGDARDPVTLSGGETFVVSLALALGLADVVSGEAGGTQLDTLFVDEGFGSLDADTLDDVMDTLDSLRDGGRVVGVVSHVTELRSRIPVQVHVDKARVGSTLRLVRADG